MMNRGRGAMLSKRSLACEARLGQRFKHACGDASHEAHLGYTRGARMRWCSVPLMRLEVARGAHEAQVASLQSTSWLKYNEGEGEKYGIWSDGQIE